MEHISLPGLIKSLEYGTRLHISVVFRNRYGNKKTRLPFAHAIHQCPVCDAAKKVSGLEACFRCRNIVLRMASQRKKSFGGFCVKGVYEYCRPVIRDGEVLAVIFVGNILTDSDEQRRRLRKHIKKVSLLKTMQQDFSEADCARTADVVESYILFLLDRYGDTPKESANALIGNIKSYIEENLLYDFSMTDLSAVFNYNEKYLGRLFKTKTGFTIKEYCNNAKVEKAKKLLKNSRTHISDIATQSGFNNVTYFNRMFRTIVGISPQEYREQNSVQP